MSSASSAWRPGSWTTRSARSTRCGRVCGSSTACATGPRLPERDVLGPGGHGCQVAVSSVADLHRQVDLSVDPAVPGQLVERVLARERAVAAERNQERADPLAAAEVLHGDGAVAAKRARDVAVVDGARRGERIGPFTVDPRLQIGRA